MADETSRDPSAQVDEQVNEDAAASRDAADARPDAAASVEDERRLSRLADYEVDDGYADIRGWPVRGSNGRELGIVGDLLVDTDLLEVAAIDVHLGVGAAGVRGNVIGAARVPIESVQLRPDRYVIVDVAMLDCEDIAEPALDANGAPMPRVPCGQIGIKRRDEASRAAWLAAHGRDVEVARAPATADVEVRPVPGAAGVRPGGTDTRAPRAD